MNIDFAFLTTVIFGFKLVFGLLFLGILCLFAINAYNAYKQQVIDFYWCVKWFFIMAVFGSLFAFASSGITSPTGQLKTTYEPKPLSENIQIETPAERIEYLDGFEPLKNKQ